MKVAIVGGDELYTAIYRELRHLASKCEIITKGFEYDLYRWGNLHPTRKQPIHRLNGEPWKTNKRLRVK